MVICLVILIHHLSRFSPCSRIPYSSPVTKILVVHPLSIQQVAKYYSRNSFIFSMIHFDGRVYPWWFSLSRPQSPRPASPFPMPFLFTLLRTLLHFFALAKIPTPLFSRDSVLFGKKTGGWGFRWFPQWTRLMPRCAVLGRSVRPTSIAERARPEVVLCPRETSSMRLA